MKKCTHCGKKNPPDAAYCYGCRNPLSSVVAAALPQRSFWSQLPSWAWIIIGLAAIALFILLIVGGFYSLAHFEGFASLIFLVIGVIVFRVFSGTPPSTIPVLRAILIGFFALMGATVDQPGNLVYNKPVEACFCPPGSSLQRTTETSHPLPGRTDMTQNFTCWTGDEAVDRVSPFWVMGVRFLEYLLLGYLLIGLRWTFWKIKTRRKH